MFQLTGNLHLVVIQENLKGKLEEAESRKKAEDEAAAKVPHVAERLETYRNHAL